MHTLVGLAEDNSFYNELLSKYNQKKNIIEKYGNVIEFLDEELLRTKKDFIEPMKITTNGTILASFSYGKYAKMAYDWISAGLDWPLDSIVNNALKEYKIAFKEININEVEFSENIIANLTKGVAYFLYKRFLEGEKQQLLEVQINSIEFDNIPQRLLLVYKLGVIDHLVDDLNINVSSGKMQKLLVLS